MTKQVVKVSQVMQTSLHKISGLASIQEAIAVMELHKVSSLVIERRDQNDEFGVITVHDIAAQIIAHNKSTQRTSVYEVMTKPAVTVDAGMAVKYAIRLLSRFQLSRALVTRGGELLGIVTLRDMVLAFANPEQPPSEE